MKLYIDQNSLPNHKKSKEKRPCEETQHLKQGYFLISCDENNTQQLTYQIFRGLEKFKQKTIIFISMYNKEKQLLSIFFIFEIAKTIRPKNIPILFEFETKKLGFEKIELYVARIQGWLDKLQENMYEAQNIITAGPNNVPKLYSQTRNSI